MEDVEFIPMAKRTNVGMLVALGLGLLASGCIIFEEGTARSPVVTAGGRHAEVGYFQPSDSGYYAYLTKGAQGWELDELTTSQHPVASGQELLYLELYVNGSLHITPVWDEHTWVANKQKTMLTCDPTNSEYSACNSAFAKTVPLLAEKRKLDREAILLALEQSGTLARIEQAQTDAEASARARKKTQLALVNIRPSVSEVVNTPGLIPLGAEEAFEHLSVKRLENVENSAGSFWAFPEFQPLTRHLPRAIINCALVPDTDKYRVDNALSGPAALDIVARVEHCDLHAPVPPNFLAKKNDSPLIITLTKFSPLLNSLYTISNTSDNYVTVVSFSIYYFSNIVTISEPFRVPPHGTTDKSFASTFPLDSYRFNNVTESELEQKSFTFGVAVEYQSEGVASKTMLSVEQVPLKAAL